MPEADLRTVPVKHITTQMIEDRFIKMDVGDMVTYEELRQLTNLDLGKMQQRARSARNTLLNQHRIVIQCVANVGYRRANDVEKLAEGAAAVRSTRRKARRALKVQSTVEYDNMSREQKIQHNLSATILSAIATLGDKPSRTKIEHAVSQNEGRLDIGDTLRLFNGKS